MVFSGRHKLEEQEKFHRDLCSIVGCICCRWHGSFNDYCSIHHIDGRTKSYAHWYVLPLCGGHHQEGANTDHPWILAVHPKKRSKAEFEAKYGTEDELWLQCFQILEYIPQGVRDWLQHKT